MSIRVQLGPPGSLGASRWGVAGNGVASPQYPSQGGQQQWGQPPVQPYGQSPQQQQIQMYPPPSPQQQQQQGYTAGYSPQRFAPPPPSGSVFSGHNSVAPQPQPYDPRSTGPQQAMSPVSAAAAAVAWGPPVVGAPALEREQSVIQPEVRVMARMKLLEDLAPDSRLARTVFGLVVLLVDMFKLCMASMLSVFVPQLCPGNEEAEGGPSNCTLVIGPHDCSFQENFQCLSTFNVVVLFWNFLCLAALVLHYTLVWRRENFMIEFFNESLEHGRLHIKELLPSHPTIAIRLYNLNKWVFNTSVLVICLQLVNIGISGHLVLNIYANGYKSYTTFFTNMLLIGIVLAACVQATYVGLKHQLAYSCVAFEPISYNSVQSHNIKGA